MEKFNQIFLDRMKNILKDEYNDFLISLNQPSQKSILVNTNKIGVDDFKEIVNFDIAPISYESAGFYIEQDKKGRHPLHHAGAFYIQEPGAMFTVNCFKFKGDEIVLDMCASPGGKSIQIANRLNQGGVLISNEINKSRSEILYSNIERMGLKNVIITNETSANIGVSYSNSIDVCLVDAPCSGEGMFRKGDKMIESWNENLNIYCQSRQLEILENANKVLKCGGYLIYSTCTYAQEENEDVVRKFLDKHNYKLVEIKTNLPRGIDMSEAVRLYPHKVKGEGQFVALLQKLEENDLSPTRPLKLKENLEGSRLFYECTQIGDKIYEYKNFCYRIPDINLIKSGVSYLSLGVRVAEILKGRIEPYHYLFTAFGGNFSNKIETVYDSLEISKYLRGETLCVDKPEGYGAVLLNDCALGGYKIIKSKFKNLYPKGLRNF